MASIAAFKALARATATVSAMNELSFSGFRSMSVIVEVKDNRIQQALSELNRKREEAGIPEELRRRRYYMNGSERRYDQNKRSYKKAVGRVVAERIKWVLRRKATQ